MKQDVCEASLDISSAGDNSSQFCGWRPSSFFEMCFSLRLAYMLQCLTATDEGKKKINVDMKDLVTQIDKSGLMFSIAE